MSAIRSAHAAPMPRPAPVTMPTVMRYSLSSGWFEADATATPMSNDPWLPVPKQTQAGFGSVRRADDGAVAAPLRLTFGATPVDGPLVRAEIAGDHPGVVAHRGRVALGNDRPGLQAVHPVADAHDERHVVLNEEDRRVELPLHGDDERTEGLGLALRQPRRGLVEAEDLGVERQQAGQLDHPPGSGREVGDVVVPVAAQAEQVDEVADCGAVAAGSAASPAAGRARSRARPSRSSPRAPPAGSRSPSTRGTAWPTGTSGPAPTRLGRRAACRRSPRRPSRTEPEAGTKPPIAFISVDLPAPLLPMSPTISRAPTLTRGAVDGDVAAEGHPEVGDGERRHAGCRGARARGRAALAGGSRRGRCRPPCRIAGPPRPRRRRGRRRRPASARGGSTAARPGARCST